MATGDFMKIITIASGKGGVGKSMLASSLAMVLAESRKVITVDCDVDAPNLGLSLGLKDSDYDTWKEITTNEKAELIESRCNGCKKCVDVCNFNAIEWDDERDMPVFDRMFCEGCGACELVCPRDAIVLKKAMNAKIGTGKTRYGFGIVSGQLKMGESGSGKIVFVTKKTAEDIGRKEGAEIMLIDAAAGIGCPVIASITGSDYVVAVTEPTPSAFSDLERVLRVVEHFGIPYGLVINKHDINNAFTKRVEHFAKGAGIPIIGKIPYDKEFVKANVGMKPIVSYDRGKKKMFQKIASEVLAHS